jgi:hypothetical protein
VARRLGHGWGPAVAAAAVLVFTACGDDGRAAGGATTTTSSTTTTTEAPTTTTTEVIDPTTVPDEITAEYVQAVLDELYALQGEALRELIAVGQLNEKTVGLLEAVYADAALIQTLNSAEALVFNGFAEIRNPPGDVKVTVQSLVRATKSCVFVVAEQDYSQVRLTEVELPPTALALVPASVEQIDRGNPTAWAIASDFWNEDGSPVEDQCDALS